MKEMKRKIPHKKQESRKYDFYCAIMIPMSKTILVAGKNMPEASSFTDGISHSGRNIIVSGNITDSEETRKLTIAERKANQAAYEEEKAQEAISKSLGLGIRGYNFKDIEILRDNLGKPIVTTYNNLKEICIQYSVLEIKVSISHTDNYAVANAITITK